MGFYIGLYSGASHRAILFCTNSLRMSTLPESDSPYDITIEGARETV